ncbi:MAG TPA: cbb3-type cytochrome c oxidase subunit 3 [Cyclobacteriaceae bacterium]|nr:cbb3-type cytochrome c oxidase subunit 3 [Cyclobacteriaceae bacterium]
MYKSVLQNMDNIAIWPIISFVIFFIFFLCLLWWVFTADKDLIEKMKNLPIDKLPKEKNSIIKK